MPGSLQDNGAVNSQDNMSEDSDLDNSPAGRLQSRLAAQRLVEVKLQAVNAKQVYLSLKETRLKLEKETIDNEVKVLTNQVNQVKTMNGDANCNNAARISDTGAVHSPKPSQLNVATDLNNELVEKLRRNDEGLREAMMQQIREQCVEMVANKGDIQSQRDCAENVAACNAAIDASTAVLAACKTALGIGNPPVPASAPALPAQPVQEREQVNGNIATPVGLPSQHAVRLLPGPAGLYIPRPPVVQPVTPQPQDVARPAIPQPDIPQAVARPVISLLVARPVARPIMPQPVARPIMPQPVARPIMPLPVARPIMPQPVARPIMPLPVARPIMPQPVARPIMPLPVARPIMPQANTPVRVFTSGIHFSTISSQPSDPSPWAPSSRSSGPSPLASSSPRTSRGKPRTPRGTPKAPRGTPKAPRGTPRAPRGTLMPPRGRLIPPQATLARETARTAYDRAMQKLRERYAPQVIGQRYSTIDTDQPSLTPPDKRRKITLLDSDDDEDSNPLPDPACITESTSNIAALSSPAAKGEPAGSSLEDVIDSFFPQYVSADLSLKRQIWKTASSEHRPWSRLDLSGLTLCGHALRHVFHHDTCALKLHGAQIKDPVVDASYPFSSLQYLDLSGVQISEEGSAALLRRCNKLRKLSLGGLALDMAVCIAVSRNKDLEVLDLSQCSGLDDMEVSAITAGCTKLTALSVGGTSLDDSTLAALCSKLTDKIQRLDLSSQMKLRAKHIGDLCDRCIGLVELDVALCYNFTELDMLTSLPRLERLALRCYTNDFGDIMMECLPLLPSLNTLLMYQIKGERDWEEKLIKALPGLKIEVIERSAIAQPNALESGCVIWDQHVVTLAAATDRY